MITSIVTTQQLRMRLSSRQLADLMPLVSLYLALSRSLISSLLAPLSTMSWSHANIRSTITANINSAQSVAKCCHLITINLHVRDLIIEQTNNLPNIMSTIEWLAKGCTRHKAESSHVYCCAT